MANWLPLSKITEQGVIIEHNEQQQLLAADSVILCTGQQPYRPLLQALQQENKTVHLIGGAKEAKALDAKRAIKQGTELALTI